MTDATPVGYLDTLDGPAMVYGHDATGLQSADLLLLGDTIASAGEWADALGISRNRVGARLRMGWCALDALGGEPRFEHDPAARRFVDEHGAATLEAIGEHFGLSRERARQIEEHALRKAEAAVHALGMEPEALLYELQQRTTMWDGMVLASDVPHHTARHAILEALDDGEWWRACDVAAHAHRDGRTIGKRLSSMARRGELEQRREGGATWYRLPAGQVAA